MLRSKPVVASSARAAIASASAAVKKAGNSTISGSTLSTLASVRAAAFASALAASPAAKVSAASAAASRAAQSSSAPGSACVVGRTQAPQLAAQFARIQLGFASHSPASDQSPHSASRSKHPPVHAGASSSAAAHDAQDTAHSESM